MTQATTALANSYFSVFVSLISLVVFLTAGSDPELPVIDFDSNSSSTRLTASMRSWSVSSWQRDSCSWWRNVLKRSRSFISAYPHNQTDFDCLLILNSTLSFCTRKVRRQVILNEAIAHLVANVLPNLGIAEMARVQVQLALRDYVKSAVWWALSVRLRNQ